MPTYRSMHSRTLVSHKLMHISNGIKLFIFDDRISIESYWCALFVREPLAQGFIVAVGVLFVPLANGCVLTNGADV